MTYNKDKARNKRKCQDLIPVYSERTILHFTKFTKIQHFNILFSTLHKYSFHYTSTISSAIFGAVALYMKHLGVKSRAPDSKKGKGFFRRKVQEVLVTTNFLAGKPQTRKTHCCINGS